MKVISPKTEFITEANPLRRIELCARVCYKSEAKITDDSARFLLGKLVERGHLSPFEHARVIVSGRLLRDLPRKKVYAYGLVDRIAYIDSKSVAMNCRDIMALGGDLVEIATLDNASDYLTCKFTCDRAIANELVRHRVFSFSQESTRYVKYRDGLTLIRPEPFAWAGRIKAAPGSEEWETWWTACTYAERTYCAMIESGASPQEARTVLPLSLKTELVMTGTLDNWGELLKMRLASGANPQLRPLLEPVAAKLEEMTHAK